MQYPSPARRFGYQATETGYAVAFVSAHGDLIAVSEHPTPDSAAAEARRLNLEHRAAALLAAATAAAHRPRCARPVRCFPPDEFA
jgi:hypothetical protein